jgi:ABC-type multidrug transport system fused ATPase/permease subunit
LANWRAQIAVVPQDIYVTDQPVHANIAFGEPSHRVNMDRVRRAAEQAAIHSFIAQLPDGYATMLGERGVALSGGQRQRIAIARALYRNTRVLIFDEATSALDPETEAEVMAAIGRLAGDLTLVLISHREAHLAACDILLRLEGGRLKPSDAAI